MSVTAGFTVQVTRTLPCVVAGPVTTQAYEPEVVEVVVKVVIGLYVVPPSRLSSMLTTCPVPRLWLNVRLCEDPIDQLTLVFGDVTVTNGLATVKFTLLRP